LFNLKPLFQEPDIIITLSFCGNRTKNKVVAGVFIKKKKDSMSEVVFFVFFDKETIREILFFVVTTKKSFYCWGAKKGYALIFMSQLYFN